MRWVYFLYWVSFSGVRYSRRGVGVIINIVVKGIRGFRILEILIIFEEEIKLFFRNFFEFCVFFEGEFFFFN